MAQEVLPDIMDLFYILKKRLFFIAASALGAGVALLVISGCIMHPVYASQATLIINVTTPSALTVTGNDVALSQELIDTYAVILKGDTLLGEVKNDLALTMNLDRLAKEITVKGVGSTQILVMTVKDRQPERATAIAEDIIRRAPAEIGRTVKTGSIEVISPAKTESTPVSPNIPAYTAIGFAAGLLISAISTVVFDMLSDKIRSEEDIRSKLGFAVLGVIPDIGTEERKGLLRWKKAWNTRKTVRS